MDVKKNRLSQDIDIDNNPVINNIIPEDKDIKKETPTTPTPVITEEEIKPIEQNNTVEETIEPVIEPIQETPRPAVKNTVRYIDSGFTF
jgi:hypothetical protein